MKLVPQTLTRKIGRELLTAKKHSPRAMFVVGIAGTVISTVMACRATLKLPALLDEMQSDVDGVKELKHFDNPASKYPKQENAKDMAYAYAVNVYRVTKLYAPSVLVGAASIGLLTSSHVTLTRRNAGLTAAYSAVQMSFDAYRERVRAELGEERERDLFTATHLEESKDEKGKKQLVRVKDPNGFSVYAKCFDEFNPEWKKNSEQNRIFLNCKQNYANHLLHARGHVFLNEVYDMLAFPHTKAGCVVGWVIGEADNFIDFGLLNKNASDFINGYERSIWLDFNVDGVIYDKI